MTRQSTTEAASYTPTELVNIIRKGAEIAIQNGTPVDPKALLELIDREREQA
jgi:hypothetical protein